MRRLMSGTMDSVPSNKLIPPAVRQSALSFDDTQTLPECIIVPLCGFLWTIRTPWKSVLSVICSQGGKVSAILVSDAVTCSSYGNYRDTSAALYLSPTLTFNQHPLPDFYLLAMLTPHCCLCSFISVLQEQRLFQSIQMAAAWQWHSDHYSAQLVSVCTLSPLIWISPLDFQMSKLPPVLKLWGCWSPGELRAVLQVG